ncbi:MAG: 4'-phosphopantetheinyl transferase superfamily protein [Bacteroidota bacterium]
MNSILMPEISSQLSNPNLDTYVKLWKIEESADFFRIFPNSWSLPLQTNSTKSLESIAARFCLWELMKSLGLESLVLQQDERQRPFLNHPHWHISISHSYPFTVACISKNTFTGIDLEKIDRNVQKIAPRFLNPTELAAWQDDNLKLTLAWSAKESIYKAWRKPGLSFQREIELHVDENQISGRVNQQTAFNIEYELFDEFVITLVNH